jgi:hypothetical protein
VIELQAHHGTRFSHGRRARAAASPSPSHSSRAANRVLATATCLDASPDGAGMRTGANPAHTPREWRARPVRLGIAGLTGAGTVGAVDSSGSGVTVLVACGVGGVGQGDDQPLGRQMSMAKESGADPKAGDRGINDGPAIGARSCQHTHCDFPAHRLRPVGLSNVQRPTGQSSTRGNGRRLLGSHHSASPRAVALSGRQIRTIRETHSHQPGDILMNQEHTKWRLSSRSSLMIRGQ